MPSRSSAAWKASPTLPAELPHRVHGVLRRAGNPRPHGEAGGEQGRRLALDHPEVLVAGDGTAVLEGDVELLALDQPQASVLQLRDHLERPLRVQAAIAEPQQGEAGERVHAVAGVDRLRDAGDGPERGAAAPGFALILDVVVEQREVMDELDGGGGREGLLDFAPQRLRREQQRRRAQQLARRGLGGASLDVLPPEVVAHPRVERSGVSADDVAHLADDVRAIDRQPIVDRRHRSAPPVVAAGWSSRWCSAWASTASREYSSGRCLPARNSSIESS